MPGAQAMRFKSALCLIVASLFCFQFPLFAQVTGSITGAVRDSTGASIPGAAISVYNTERGIHRSTVSNSTGDYLVEGLGEGTYTVLITAPGFEKYVAANMVIRVGQNARVDGKLKVGSQSEEVTVEGSAAGTVETQSSELS